MKDDRLHTTSIGCYWGWKQPRRRKISLLKGYEKIIPTHEDEAHLLFTTFLHTCMHITHRFKNSPATFEIGFVFTWTKKKKLPRKLLVTNGQKGRLFHTRNNFWSSVQSSFCSPSSSIYVTDILQVARRLHPLQASEAKCHSTPDLLRLSQSLKHLYYICPCVSAANTHCSIALHISPFFPMVGDSGAPHNGLL